MLTNPCNNLEKCNNFSKIQQEQWETFLIGKAMIGLGSDKKEGLKYCCGLHQLCWPMKNPLFAFLTIYLHKEGRRCQPWPAIEGWQWNQISGLNLVDLVQQLELDTLCSCKFCAFQQEEDLVHWPSLEMDTFQHTDKKPLNTHTKFFITQIQNLSIHKYKTPQQTNKNISMHKYKTFQHTNKKPFSKKILTFQHTNR